MATVLSLIPLPVRNFANINHTLLIVIVPFTLMFIIGGLVDHTIPNLTPGITACCVFALYAAIRDARLYRKYKEALGHIYTPLMRKTAFNGIFLTVVALMGVAEMLGYTYDKNGVGMLFVLCIGTLF